MTTSSGLLTRTLLALCCVIACLGAVDTRHISVTPTVNTSAPSVTLAWDQQDPAVNVTVSRREMPSTAQAAGTAFTTLATYNSGTQTHTDTGVVAGKTYEYRVWRPAAMGSVSISESAAYLAITIAAPLEDLRGTVLLVVDASLLPELEHEVALLELDLAGDGWKVTRLLTQPHGLRTPQALRADIQAARAADPTINALYLFGRIPYALSGWIAPDGHDSQAHPTDQYYADINGTWTDSTYNVTGPTGPEYGSNIAGDGKLDQNIVPSAVELMTGRVDMSKLTRLRKNEREYLRDYIQKSHAWRHGRRPIPYRGVSSEPYLFMETNALRGMFTPASCPGLGFDACRSTPQIWACSFGNDGSQFDSNYGAVDNQAIFTINFGSAKQMFSHENNLMRVMLAQADWGLTSGWGARPAWHVHHMAAGKPIGYSFLRTVSNIFLTPPYHPRGEYSWMDSYVSINLMGDPTLRMHPVAPARALLAVHEGTGVRLDWTADAAASLSGFHVYRSSTRTGAYQRLTASPLGAATRSYLDSSRPAGDLYYQVRAVHQTVVPTGSFANASQGVFAWISGSGATRPALPAVVHSAMTAQTGVPTPVAFPASITGNPDLVPIVLSNPAKGQLRWSAGRAYYVSQPNYTGSDAFTYRISDGISVGDPVTVDVTVTDRSPDALLGWSFADPGWAEQPTASTWSGDFILPSVLQRGSGVAVTNQSPLNAGGYYISGCDSPALDANDWLGWTLTPDGAAMSLNRLVFFAAAGGQAAGVPMSPFGMELRVSLDGFANWQTVPFEQGADALQAFYNKGNGGRIYSADLSTVAALQDRAGPVAFRLYVWGTPSFSIGRSGDNAAQNAMDLVVLGRASPPPAGAFQLAASSYQIDEGSSGQTNLAVVVSRVGSSQGAVSVAYATAPGSATAGQDYVATSGVLTWADGDASTRTIQIGILGDTAGEFDETLRLDLSSPTGGAKLATPSGAVITIRNDDTLIPIARVNFQPASSVPPAGWLVDSGQLYGNRGNGFTYGWDVDATTFTRERASATIDITLRTMMHMQYFAVTNWDFAIANGSYIVHVVAGDPDYYNSVYRIAVEGTVVADGTPTAASPWAEGWAVVTVADGKLSVTNASGSSNNKIDYIEIFQSGAAGNTAPSVAAGPDLSVTLPASATLDGTVSDDGLPAGSTLTTAWTKTSGPGTVTFGSAAAVDTTASFSAAGTYVLRLTASDGTLSALDETTVTVSAAPLPIAAAPTFNPPAGTYASAQSVAISTASAGASIRYTTDGSVPTTTTGTIYSGPVTVSTSLTINAIAYGSGYATSAVATATYVIQTPNAPTGLTATPGIGQIRLDWVDNATNETGYTVQTLVGGGPGGPLIAPGNAIVGTSSNYPAAESPDKAIDGLSGSKYLNFDKLNTGFTVSLSAPGAASSIALTSASDAPERDPTSVSIAGSDDGVAFTTIVANLSIPAFTARLQTQTLTFANTTAYARYRIIFPTVANPATANSMQVAEVQLHASGGVWSDVVSLPAGATSATITGLAAGIAQSYRVCAFNGAGSSAWAGPVVATPLAPSTNAAPSAHAGPDLSITLPASATLDGTVSDDGLPTGSTLTTAWTKTSGPGTVTFGNAAAVDTTAGFSAAGTYVLRLTASDGTLSAFDEMTVTVTPAPLPTAAAPTFNPPAGTYAVAQSVAISSTSAGTSIRYTTDGSTPTSTTGILYAGPVAVAGSLTIKAIAYGTGYTASSVASAAYVIQPANAAPGVNAGPDLAATLPASVTLDGTVSDDGLPTGSTLTTAWTKTSGPGTVTFGNAAAVDTTAGFSAAGTYVLRLTASDGALSSFDETTVTVGSGLPAGWTASDIGTVTTPGSTTWAGGVWTVAGSGADIAGTQDQCRFASRQVTGDVMITARVDGLTGPTGWSMAGVMIRETADAGSRQATTDLTVDRGLQFRRRLATGGTSALTNGPKGRAPYWVRLERVGSTFTSSCSADGVTWKTIRSESIAMGATVQVGLAVCSRSNGQIATATFSNVAIVAAAAMAQ